MSLKSRRASLSLPGRSTLECPARGLGAATRVGRAFGKGLNGAKILLLSLANKKNVDDLRESPFLKLIGLLEERSASGGFHDPFFPSIPLTRDYPELAGRRSAKLDARALASRDAVLIATHHDQLDYDFVARHAKAVLDTRNACARVGVDLARVDAA